MPTVIGYHDVKDTEHWLASPKREEVFGPLGVTNIRTFVDQANRTRVAVLMDVADMDAVMAAMQNTGMADAMEYDGVLPETLVILTEARGARERLLHPVAGEDAGGEGRESPRNRPIETTGALQAVDRRWSDGHAGSQPPRMRLQFRQQRTPDSATSHRTV